MINLHSKDLSPSQTRKLLSGSVVPRPIALITSLQANGKTNMAPFSWFNIVSGSPPLLSVSIRYDDDKQKDTSRNILREKEFVVHIISYDFLEKADKTSINLGPNESELNYAHFELIESSLIKTPGVKEAKIRMECQYIHHLNLGSSDLIIGKVVSFHIDNRIYLDGKISFEELKPVARLSGKRYGLINEIISID